MLRRRAALVALFVVIAAAHAPAPAHPGYYYLDPRALDLTVLLPPPPDAASAQERADEQQVAQAIAQRSPQQMFEARQASDRSVFFFARSVGPDFSSGRLPLTAKFFQRISADVHKLVNSAKEYWTRPRPDGAVKKRTSYPSGHSAFAASTAIVLSQLMPEKRDAIFSQARIFAENRILLGLHYPTDVASGWTAGTLAAYVMMRDPAFRRDYAKVKAELQRAHLAAPDEGR